MSTTRVRPWEQPNLGRVLQEVAPVFVGNARLLFKLCKVRQLAILAKCQDEEVVQLAGLRGGLLLDDARPSPGCLADVVRIPFLL